MANPGLPVGQLAYQAVIAASYGAALRAYASASNKYGGGSNAWNLDQNAGNAPPGPVHVRRGRHGRFVPWAGQVSSGPNVITASGGSGYAANDLVTFQSVTHNRPIVIKITSVDGGGNPTGTVAVDQGGGIPAGSNGKNSASGGFTTQTLTQASTTGAGTGATWSLVIGSFGWQYPGVPNPLAV